MQSLGLAAWPAVLLLIAFGLAVAIGDALQHRLQPTPFKIFCAVAGVLLLSAALSAPAAPARWPLAAGMGGLWGDAVTGLAANGLGALKVPGARIILGLLFLALALWSLAYTVGLRLRDFTDTAGWAAQKGAEARAARPPKAAKPGKAPRAVAEAAAPARKPRHRLPEADEMEADGPAPASSAPVAAAYDEADADAPDAYTPPWEDAAPAPIAPPSARPSRPAEPKVAAVKAPKPVRSDADQQAFDFAGEGGFELPPLGILAKPAQRGGAVDEESLKANAKMLEGVLQEFGVRGQIDQIRPGPVVTLYELVPAPGVKHGRVVALADDIARSMSARACRISVVQGRNAIGIELPNAKRETVFLRDLLASGEYDKKSHLLPLALGETIG